MSPHEPRYPTSGISLKTCVEELRRRCETIASIQGGFTYYHEELEIFRAYAEEKQLFFTPLPLLNQELQSRVSASELHNNDVVLPAWTECNVVNAE
jgi:hypothetical protein